MTFSATNNNAFNLRNYYAEFSYTKGLNITGITTNPSAKKATVNSKKNLITLQWSNIGQGASLTANFYVSSNTTGNYSITPVKIYYTDSSRKVYSGTCNSSTIIVTSEVIPPSPPENIKSISGEGFIGIYWIPPGDSDVESYNIYRRTSASSYVKLNTSPIYGTSYSDTDIQNGSTYFYVVTAVDTAGNESKYSVETGEMYFNLIVGIYDITSLPSATAVGDINGDGKSDVVFGHYSDQKVNIYLGGSGSISGIPDLTLREGGGFGYSLAVVDLNADGYDDLIVGAPKYSTFTDLELGKVYVYSGGPQITATPVFTMIGEQSYGRDKDGNLVIYYISETLGFSIAPAGDVNGDSYDDVLIGAPLGGMTRSGSVVVLFGGPNLSSFNSYRFSGRNSWEKMGFSVGSAGDVDGDGHSDFLAGGPGAGRQFNPFGVAYLFYGGQYIQRSFSFNTGIENDKFGITVSSAGDINGDGYSDVAVGTDPYCEIACPSLPAPAVNIFYGSTYPDNNPDIVFSYRKELFYEKGALFFMGDLNNDTFDDFLVGPKPQIHFGNNTGENVPDILRTGVTVIGTGDIDRDGKNEIIVLKPYEYNKVYIYSLAPYLNLPEITVFSPKNNEVTTIQNINIRGLIKGNITKLKIRGQEIPLMPDGTFNLTVALFEGENIIEIIAQTPEGKISKRILTLTYSSHLTPLTLSITSPADGAILNNTPITVTGTVSDSTARVTVNGSRATVSGNTFTATGINLQESSNTVTAVATDSYGQRATHSITVTLITKGTIRGIVTDSSTGLPLSNVAATVTDSFSTYTTTTDSNGTYTISGITQGSFTATFEKSGYIKQTIYGTLNAGQTLTLNILLTPMPPLTITITSPQNGAIVSSSVITVTGNVSNNASVTVNGIQASVSNNIFSASIPLIGGPNTITATATDQYGQTASHSISITLSSTPPAPPTISNITASNITTDSATITWTTDQPSDSRVEYGTTTSYGTSVSDLNLVTTRSIVLTNLSPSTTYHFRVTSKNANGLSSSSGDNTFITLSPPAGQFTAKALGDYGNITVMEVTGNYDAKNPDGSINTLPRQVIAKEFYKNHQDNFDFMVIFSNFNFTMPDPDAKAFYLEIKNDTQGIGKTIFDNSGFFGSNSKLQGTIDMGNISSLGVSPADPKFEETLLTLAHEQMHRWGASIKFKDASGSISTALLGKDGVHWSFLLDSDGSVLYGNDWQDNKDGTFTSVSASKYYSPLDLYLMGFYDKSQVSPMLLIDNPNIDPKKMPELGATISGTARYIAINDIIAAEGQRIPDVLGSQKAFKIGYILITRPGTFTGSEVSGIENIRNAWAGRFTQLTNGKGIIMDVAPSITLSIGSPLNGETINKPEITVKGAVINTTGKETGVTVNGIVATVYCSQFIANNVPLTEGSNTITVTATDTAGTTATTSITVNAVTTGNYIRVTSNIESGIAPLEVSLRIDGSFSIISSNLNITGPGQPEFLYTSADEYKLKFIAEGIYYITASATGPDGNVYRDMIAITVMNKAQLDALLKAKWNAMKTALGTGDIHGALVNFAIDAQGAYRDQFAALGPILPDIVNELSTAGINMVSVENRIAEYEILITREGTTFSLHLKFVRDDNGLWKIWAF